MRTILSSLRLVLALTLLTGLLYPLAVTFVARLCWPAQADGSLVVADGRVVGSALVGQQFTRPDLFWGRPSATKPAPTTALDLAFGACGTGSNLAPGDAPQLQLVATRVAAIHAAERAAGVDATGAVPVDLVTASASGLDPHISLAAARYQVPRIAALRHLPAPAVTALVERCTVARPWTLMPTVVAVLPLNLLLVAATPR